MDLLPSNDTPSSPMTDHIDEMTSTIFRGLAASPGHARGTVFRWNAPVRVAIAAETEPRAALRDAFRLADERLEQARATADATLAPLLEAQRLMLDDADFRDGSFTLVEAGADPAVAVMTVADQLAAMLERADSAYFRERAIDVRALGTLVAGVLRGDPVREVPRGAVVVAEALAPLDTAHLIDAGVAAFVTVQGGATCHAAIIARAWGIPAIVGAPAVVLEIANDTPVWVDGQAGTVTTFPTEETAPNLATLPIASIERRVPIYANIGNLTEAARAVELGAEGIGLLRTEFLFQDRALPPDEDEQTACYSAILRQLAGRPVIIRTLDIGADKPAPYLPLPAEANPQLGLRGIRLCLQHRDLFHAQLRALLRASTVGPLKIMLPMVTHEAEMREVRAWIEEMAGDLRIAAPPLGAMIEVPMAAISAVELAAVCDFFSLGTNDLLQFLLAADRQQAEVSYLYASEYPAVWRLLGSVIDAAHAAGISVSVCGEWGSDPEKLPRVIALGIDTVSVAVGVLPRVRAMFR